MGNQSNALREAANWLEQKRGEIMASESKALEALDAGNVEEYGKQMRDKAAKLASLFDESAPWLKSLPPRDRAWVENDLQNFSASARNSIKLDSVFYMSALLYPDDHKKGEPDNLRLLIEKMKLE